MKLSTPENPKPTSPLKILLIGPPGSRKTTLGLQFPGVHVEDCDRNLDGPERWLRSNGRKDLSYSYNPVRYYESGASREIYECYDALLDDLKVIVKEPQIKTVFVDSLSHVNEFIIRKVLKLKAKDTMEAHHWTDFKSHAYNLLVSALERTNKTVLCSAHEIKLVENDQKNIMVQTVIGYEPFFQGKVGDTIGAFFTDVWRMELKQAPGGKLDTILQTQRHPKCEHLKNSLGMEAEIKLVEGYKTIEPFLKGKV